MEAFTKQFVLNKFGIAIVKCCASCQNHYSKGEEVIRYCKIDGSKHPLDYFCCNDCWRIIPALDNAGRGGGRVKKPQYIKFLIDHGVGHADEYERQYGSRYLTKK